MRLYIFNPDTDLALANGKGNYTPTQKVRQMINDLALLPLWFAKSGSYVLADQASNHDFLEEMNKLFKLDVELLTVSKLGSLKGSIEICPWGWNQSFRNMLGRAGIDPNNLPDDVELEAHRQLSQRKVVGELLQLFENEPDFCGFSHNLTNTKECDLFFNQMKDRGGVVFKEPWSSSGKGLLWCRDEFNVRDRNWCQRVIGDEGYVTAMPIYNKVQDFAMEFYVGEATVSFLGYSLFNTDHKGFYKGNALLSNEEIERLLTKYVPKTLLDRTLKMVGDFLTQKGYKGCVGVDMMICQEAGEMLIHPCVEINYRATMGYLARVLKDNFLADDVQGWFMIRHFRTHEELVRFAEGNKVKSPLHIQQNRIYSGFLPLVPVLSSTLNLAYIEVS